MARNSKPVTIKTHNVGQNFGCCATVHAQGKKVYETDTYAFGGNIALLKKVVAQIWSS